MEKYTKLEELGRGSYGVVWKALNKQTGEVVAVKNLMQQYESWEECKNLKEVKSLTKLGNHPNIVNLKELIRQSKLVFLIFEYMQCDLYKLMRSRFRSNKRFSETEIRDFCFQIFQGLTHMHRNGYFHRDLKPENLLVNNKVIKIGDLGMVRESNSQRPYTHNVTTLWYRAPEVFLRSPVYDSAIDMWAMGAIMFELFALEPLFGGDSEADVLSKICSVLGTPTERTWYHGLELAKNMFYRFPEARGVPFSELLPYASPNAVNLISSLLSWCPYERPTAMQALEHPFFHGCYRVPPGLLLKGSNGTILTFVPFVFKLAMKREFFKIKQSQSGSKSEDEIHMLLQNPFDIYKKVLVDSRKEPGYNFLSEDPVYLFKKQVNSRKEPGFSFLSEDPVDFFKKQVDSRKELGYNFVRENPFDLFKKRVDSRKERDYSFLPEDPFDQGVVSSN